MFARVLSALSLSALVAVAPASASASIRRTTPVPVVTKAINTVTKAATPVAAATTPVAAAAPVVVAVPTLAELSLSASDGTTCDDASTFQAFKAFGDTADYSFAPGGSFENGADGWTLDDASLASGNDTSGVYAGTKSLRILDHGEATSPWFCVNEKHPTLRYTTFGGEVNMKIDYKIIGDDDIDDHYTDETRGGSKWAPSTVTDLATKIPASKLKRGVVARLVFKADDDVSIDNVLVDPYRRG